MSFPLHIAYVGQEIRILNLRCVLSGISLKIPVILKVTTLFNLNVFPRALTPPKYFFAIDSEITEVYGSFSAEESIPVISSVSYTHLLAHETDSYLVCRL